MSRDFRHVLPVQRELFSNSRAQFTKMSTEVNNVMSRSLRRRPEIELLLGCARSRMDPVSAESVRQALRQSIDWDFVIDQAAKHGVIPLLSWNLSRFELDSLPKATFNRLKNEFAAIARRNLFLTGELIKLLNLFRENGIRALPLKGPVLAATTYGNVSLRHFGDLDILISSDDFLAAKDLLRQQGYQPEIDLTASEERKYLRSHHDYPLCRIS